MRQRILKQAESLRSLAANLEQLAKGEIVSPSPAEFSVRVQLVKVFL
jgi:hypothetical protein